MGRPEFEVEGGSVLVIRGGPGDFMGGIDEGVLEERVVKLASESGIVNLEGKVDDGFEGGGRGVEGGKRGETVAEVEEVEGVREGVVREPGESFGDGGGFEKVRELAWQRRSFLESCPLEKASSLLVLSSAKPEKHCSRTDCGCKGCGDRFSGR